MSSYLPIKSLHVIFINFIVVFKLVSFSIVGKILKSTRTWRYLVPVLKSHIRKVPIKIGLSLKALFKNLKIIRMGDLLEWYVGYCFIFCQKIKLLTAPINVSQMLPDFNELHLCSYKKLSPSYCNETNADLWICSNG